MDWVLRVAVAVTFVTFLVWAFLPRREFVIRLRGGEARLLRGRVPVGFLDQVAEVCADAKVVSGSVWGSRQGRRVHLGFSGSIPEACRQRLRNVWNLPR